MSIGKILRYTRHQILHVRRSKYGKPFYAGRKRVTVGGPLGTRMVYWNKKTGKIKKSVPYSKYSQGKRMQEITRVKKAEERILKNTVSTVAPPIGKIITVGETVYDINTIRKKGKKA